jgi:hypothetical protein
MAYGAVSLHERGERLPQIIPKKYLIESSHLHVGLDNDAAGRRYPHQFVAQWVLGVIAASGLASASASWRA